MRKKILFLFILVFFMPLASARGFGDFSPDQDWKLIWSDEFDEDTINLNNWGYDTGFGPNNDGWGVWGVQDYTKNLKNAFIKDGKLILKAYYLGGPYKERNYTSAKLTTEGKQEFRYGKIQARIKMPYGKGIFPAFWMLGNTFEKVGWPQCGEIDITEMFGGGKGKDNVSRGNAHFFDETKNKLASVGGVIRSKENLSEKFHVYEIEWSDTEIIWRFDNLEYLRSSIDSRAFPEKSELHNKFFLILNLGVGAYPEEIGYPDATTVFPQTMEVDWVRVYQKE